MWQSCVLLALMGAAAAWPAEYRIERGITYAAPAGRDLKLNLYLPSAPSEAPRPAVVLIHGGAWLFGTRHQLDFYGRHLAERGYVAAAITYRMMPRNGFPSCLHDAKAAVRWLRCHANEYRIDPNRIAALGNSAGGQLVSLLGLTRPEDGLEGDQVPGYSSAVQAVVDFYGVADLTYYQQPRGYIRLGGFTRQFIKSFVTKEQKGAPNPYDRASPITYVHPDSPPFLIIHGLKDGQVPYQQAVQFKGKLTEAGVSARLITVPFGHAYDFFHPNTRRKVFGEVVQFLECNLR